MPEHVLPFLQTTVNGTTAAPPVGRNGEHYTSTMPQPRIQMIGLKKNKGDNHLVRWAD